MNLKRTLLKTTAVLGSVAALGTAVIGVAHTPWGRPLLKLPLLSAMASRAGCPVGKIEPAAFEQIRASKLRAEAGSRAAQASPALGFTLGSARRSDIERWIANQQLTCREGAVASVLECQDVWLTGQPKISTLRLQFDPSSRLVSVDLFRAAAPAEDLVARYAALGRELERDVGPATTSVGQASVEFMKSAPLQTAMLKYSYQNYVAQVLLMNLGQRGLRLREQYQWLGPAPA